MQNDTTKPTGRTVRDAHGWKGKRWQLCWVRRKDRSSLKSVVAELKFQGGIHQMDHEEGRVCGRGHSTCRSLEMWKRKSWRGTMGAWEMKLNRSPCRAGLLKEAVGTERVVGVPGCGMYGLNAQ